MGEDEHVDLRGHIIEMPGSHGDGAIVERYALSLVPVDVANLVRRVGFSIRLGIGVWRNVGAG